MKLKREEKISFYDRWWQELNPHRYEGMEDCEINPGIASQLKLFTSNSLYLRFLLKLIIYNLSCFLILSQSRLVILQISEKISFRDSAIFLKISRLFEKYERKYFFMETQQVVG